MMLENTEIILRLAVAAFCAGLIGLERERKEWTAGMRTHMMVGVGAALYMIVSAYGFSHILSFDKVGLDPSRVAAQVVSGIGFLGAGTIIFLRQGVIRGLTTASGLWTVAGIGLAVGGGLYIAGIATTLIAIIILWILQPIEAKLYRKTKLKHLRAVLNTASDAEQLIKSILGEEKYAEVNFSIERKDGNAIILNVSSIHPGVLREISQILQESPTVKHIDLNVHG